MPTPKGAPTEGQLGLDGIEVHIPRVDLDRPNSLSRALTTEYMGLSPRDYTDVTAGAVEDVTPAKLEPYLIDVPFSVTGSPFSASYTDRSRRNFPERNIAFTSRELQRFPRHLGGLQRGAALLADARTTSAFPEEEDEARVGRSRLHVQEAFLPSAISFKAALAHQGELLDKFIWASDGANYRLSHLGNEGDLRARLVYLQTSIIANMIRAYGNQRRLSGAEMRTADRAVTVGLFMHPEKFTRFHDLVVFLRTYNKHKIEVVGQRIESMERNLGRQVVQRSR